LAFGVRRSAFVLVLVLVLEGVVISEMAELRGKRRVRIVTA
jgi:hypothetical protein